MSLTVHKDKTHAFSNNGGSKKSTAVSVGKTPVKSLIFPGTRNTKWFKHKNFVNLHVEAGLSGRMFFYLYYKDSSESGYLSSGTTDRQLYLSNHRLEEGDVIYINIGNMKGESGYFTIQCTYEAWSNSLLPGSSLYHAGCLTPPDAR